MTAVALSAIDSELAGLPEKFVTWLENGIRPADLFTDDVFVDLSLPQWRLQAAGTDPAFHVREDSHPFRGEVRLEGLDRTSRGFLIQFEERWDADGQHWYCREMIHCIVAGDRISELAVYCTGDWDEATQQAHAGQVRLIRA